MASNDTPAERSLLDPVAPVVPKVGVTVTIGPSDSEGSDPTNQVSVVIIKEGSYDVEPEDE